MKRVNGNLKIGLPLLVLAVFVGILSYFYYQSLQKPEKVIPEQVWKVNTIQAKAGTHVPLLTLYGQVESHKLTKLEAAIEADILDVPVKEGDYVEKGALLVQLDDREAVINVKQKQGDVNDLKAQIASEKNRAVTDKAAYEYQKKLVEIQKREAQRLLTLVKQKVGSESAYDKALLTLTEQSLKLEERQLSYQNHKHRLAQLQGRLLKAEAQLEQAVIDLERTKVRAPFSGRITKVNIAIGNRVQKGEVLVEMFSTDTVEVRSQIPAPYLSLIKKELNSNTKLPAKAFVDGQWIPLQLSRLAGALDTGQGGVDAIFTVLNNQGRQLEKGRIIELQLRLPAVANVIPVPPSTLYDNNIIYIIHDHRLLAVTIQQFGLTENSDGNQMLLIGSEKLKNGDLIVTTHLPNARSGLKVEAIATAKEKVT